MRRVVIVLLFLFVFSSACFRIYKMKGESVPTLEPVSTVNTAKTISDSVHSYSASDVKSGCEAEDGHPVVGRRVLQNHSPDDGAG